MSSNNIFAEETIQQKLEKDLNYIKNDIITQISKNNYCKFSRPINAICVLNFTKESYIKYWTQSYAKYPKEKRQIIEACEEKFKNNLTDKDTMIKLVEDSNDHTKDKDDALSLLTGKPLKRLSAKELKREEELNAFKLRFQKH